MERRWPRDDGGRKGSDVSTSQRMPRRAGDQKLRERHGAYSLLEPSEGARLTP